MAIEFMHSKDLDVDIPPNTYCHIIYRYMPKKERVNLIMDTNTIVATDGYLEFFSTEDIRNIQAEVESNEELDDSSFSIVYNGKPALFVIDSTGTTTRYGEGTFTITRIDDEGQEITSDPIVIGG